MRTTFHGQRRCRLERSSGTGTLVQALSQLARPSQHACGQPGSRAARQPCRQAARWAR